MCVVLAYVSRTIGHLLTMRDRRNNREHISFEAAAGSGILCTTTYRACRDAVETRSSCIWEWAYTTRLSPLRW